MKKLYFLFFLTIGFFANAQIVNIPDANFKAKLLSANTINSIASFQIPVYNSAGNTWSVPSYNKIDVNNDGEIQVSEAQMVTYLDIGYSSISNLTGIEYFTNLNILYCRNNQLTSLNLSPNTNLKVLNCIYNQITNLDLISCTNLLFLNCNYNQLVNLNLSSNNLLEYLFCENNQINTLDLITNNNLKYLSCKTNSINNLQVLSPNLTYIDCNYNQLVSLNVSSCSSLNELRCSYNLLTNLITNISVLEKIECTNNNLLSLDLTQNNNLKSLDCGSNDLVTINLLQNHLLTYLSIQNNFLNSIDVSQNQLLELFYCDGNSLVILDVSNNSKINTLTCTSNNLEILNLKNGNINYSTLIFSFNPNLMYVCADEQDLVSVQQKINTYGYAATCHVNTYCSFTPGGTFYEISGNTKFDSNNNGCDVLDINYSNLRFNITEGTVTGSLIANQIANYYIPVSAGNHTITPNLENPSYFNISPASFTVNFPTQTSPFTQNFCVTANGVKSDVEVILLQTTPARPGFDATYKLVYRNKGNQVENGIVSLTFDDARLDYVAANPVYNSSAMNSFTWNYTNLQPFETREIEIVFNVNSPMEIPSVNIGNVLNYTTTITTASTDETPTDNTFTLDQTVVGSYDPNDKTCLQGTTITPTEVGKYVHYVIRFENTGTFPAENIVVKDMIDLAKFDITTLVPLKSSHDFFTRINGNKVEFIFENINLDFNDATNDGYVVFKIKTKPTLVVGNTFTNNANIYFDYNFPITTNTYTTTVAALSTQDFDFGSYFTLYPNPAKDVLNIQTKQDLQVNSVEIYNQLGQIIMAVTNSVNAIDVSSLASGTYFVKINSEKGSANAKFVKE